MELLLQNKMQKNFYKSFHHRKKTIYIVISVVLSVFLIVVDVYDLTVLLAFHRAGLTTHNTAQVIMVSLSTNLVMELTCVELQILNLLSFYLSLFALVHSLEEKHFRFVAIAVMAGGNL